MRQVAGLISTYSSDEFGICSALYELGGMVVMHDASGCNSTYTTHDEPRWYDMDSMIFISAISEMEAIMGDDEKLIDDLIETAGELHPEFIAVTGAPIPYMIGTDLDAIAMITEQETGIPCMGFAANGMNNYTKGVYMALEKLTDRFCCGDRHPKEGLSVNILGATPLDFSLNGAVNDIRKWLIGNGADVNCCMAMGSTLEEIKGAGNASVNLVISYGGLGAAKILKKRYGIPYVVGVPFGEKFPDILFKCLLDAAEENRDIISYKEIKNQCDEKNKNVIIGESVFSCSLAAAIAMDKGISFKVLCPLDTLPSLLREKDSETPEEDDLIRELNDSQRVIADPMYQVIAGSARFTELPHEAFSGRIYDAVNPNMICRRLPFEELEENAC